MNAPARLSCPQSIAESFKGTEAVRVREWLISQKWNVIESEVPNAGIDHSVGAKCHCSANDCASEDVVPVVKFVDCESAANQRCAKYWHVGDDELPVGWVVI